MKKSVLTLVTIAVLAISSFAQVAINTTGDEPSASAILDLSSTDKGLLIPRMSTDNRTNDVTAAEGLLVYDTDTDSFWYYDSQWIELVTDGAMGINGLSDGKTDEESVFLGAQSGNSDNGENYNVGIGIQALRNNISGERNVAIGNAALRMNIVSSNMVAIGDSALYNNSSPLAKGNTAIGSSALFSNTNGYSNTATGYLSLYNNTYGDYNTAIGNRSLYSNTSGDLNTANGTSSLVSNTTGNNNTAMGFYALKSNETGNSNTAIGYEAGRGSTGENVSGCVYIGYQAGRNNTSSSKLFIDNSLTSTPLIGGDFAADEIYLHGDVGIGTSYLLERLHIAEDNSTTDGTDGSFALIQNTSMSNNVLTGIRFKNGPTDNTSKGGIYYKDMLTYGRGDIVFVNNSAGSEGNATFADARMTIKNDGKVGIGTTDPGAELEVNGQVKITGGIPGADKVLTSDADGLATWETKTYGATELNGLSDAITQVTNLFIGDQVGTNNNSGLNYNTAIGYNAFQTNISGVSNTALGYKAAVQNSSGHHNVAIGFQSIYYNVTGDNNTAIGSRAGSGSYGNSISGCVFLGYEAGKDNASNNKLFIDNSSTTTPLIGGDFSSDELYLNADVGIGTSSPNEQLEIAGASGANARMIMSDGEGSSRKVLLFVSPGTSHDHARIDAYDYGGNTGTTLKINVTGDGDVIFGGNVLPESHAVEDLGATGNAWDNVYAVNYITEATAAFANINVTEQLISFPPMEIKSGVSNEFTDKGLKVIDPASLPKELTQDNALLIDEMTTYNYKANYEQQQQIETLKIENAELKARLDKLEKLMKGLK